MNKILFFIFITTAAWLTSYEVEVLCESPKVVVIHNFLSVDECNHIRNLAKPYLERSTVVDSEHGGGQVHAARTSQGMFFPTHHKDPILTAVEERISAFTGIPMENGEDIQVLRYKVGGEYKPHYDYFDPNYPGQALHLERGGQRLASFLMYLNDPKEGGETVFPLLKLSVKPVKGKALLFYDCKPDGEVDTMTLHGGAPVLKGQKWLATRWLRQKRFQE